jgi:hypothetical protein
VIWRGEEENIIFMVDAFWSDGKVMNSMTRVMTAFEEGGCTWSIYGVFRALIWNLRSGEEERHWTWETDVVFFVWSGWRGAKDGEGVKVDGGETLYPWGSTYKVRNSVAILGFVPQWPRKTYDKA